MIEALRERELLGTIREIARKRRVYYTRIRTLEAAIRRHKAQAARDQRYIDQLEQHLPPALISLIRQKNRREEGQ